MVNPDPVDPQSRLLGARRQSCGARCSTSARLSLDTACMITCSSACVRLSSAPSLGKADQQGDEDVRRRQLQHPEWPRSPFCIRTEESARLNERSPKACSQ